MLPLIPFEVQWWNPFTWDNAPLLAVVAGLWVIVMIRANATYWLGRGIAGGTARTRWKRLLDSPQYLTGQRWLDKWGAPAVTFSFLTVGVQTMVNLGAGAMRMSLRRYLPAVAAGCVIWAFMYGTIGFIGWVALARLWERSPWFVVLLLALLAASAAIYFWLGRRSRTATGGTATLEAQGATTR